jgi:hypothetical protein
VHVEVVGEIGRVARPDLEEQHHVVGRCAIASASVSLRAYSAGSPVFGRLAMMRTAFRRPLPSRIASRSRRTRTPSIRISVDRSTRETSDDHDDRHDEPRRDLDALGPLDDVDDGRVEKDRRDRAGSACACP